MRTFLLIMLGLLVFSASACVDADDDGGGTDTVIIDGTNDVPDNNTTIIEDNTPDAPAGDTDVNVDVDATTTP